MNKLSLGPAVLALALKVMSLVVFLALRVKPLVMSLALRVKRGEVPSWVVAAKGHETCVCVCVQIVSVLRPALDQYFPEQTGVRIIAEPGRYFAASAFTLAVNIIAKRTVTASDSTSSSPGNVGV